MRRFWSVRAHRLVDLSDVMNILRVIPSLDPAVGGPAEGIRQMTAALDERGHRTEVASVDPPDPDWFHRYPFPVHTLGPNWTGWGYAPRFKTWMEREVDRFDAVIVHGLWQYPGFATWQVVADRAVPYYVYPHGMLDPWFKRRYPMKHVKKWLFWPWADYRLLRDADGVLFTTDAERRLARTSFPMYACRERVVGYGIRGAPKDRPNGTEELTRRHPELRGRKVVLFLSRIHPKKGCDLLIEAFARVFGDDPGWHLLMAGPDQVGWKSDLQARAQRLGIDTRITWMGMVHDNAKWATYRLADVFVLPSHQENFGIVVAEAMSCGVPVLTTNAVNTWREVVSSEGGFVARDTEEGVVRLLSRWRDLDPNERLEMGSRAKAGFQEHFEVGRAADRLIETVGADYEEPIATGQVP